MSTGMLSISRACRLCLELHVDNVNFFSEGAQKQCLIQKVWKYLSIWIHGEDSLPKNICQQCIAEIEHFSSFAAKIEQVQKDIHSNVLQTPKELLEKVEFECDKPGLTKRSMCDIKVEYNPVIEIKEESPSYHHAEGDCYDNELKQEEAELHNTGNVIENFIDHSDLIAREKEIPFTPDIQQHEDVFSKCLNNTIDHCRTVSNDNHVWDLEKQCENSKVINSNTDADIEYLKLPEKLSKLDVTLKGSFPKKGILKSQMDVASFYKLSCELCKDGEIFDNYELLEEHCVTKHNTKAAIICCGRKLTAKYMLQRHMHKHFKYYKCQLCSKEMTTPWSLNYHMLETHVPNEKRPFKCRQCPKGFATGSRLRIHEKHYHWTEEKFSCLCKICGKSYTNPRCLRTHQLNLHREGQTAMCHICPKMFTTLAALRQHLESHQQATESVQCRECGKILKNKLTMRTHMKLHSNKLLPCSQCDKMFKLPVNLKIHLRSHSNVRPYECGICKKAFKHKLVLKEHMAQHTGEQPHECPYCLRKFACKANYYTHKRKMHSKSKSVELIKPVAVE